MSPASSTPTVRGGRANIGMKRTCPARIFQSSGSRLAAKIFTFTSPAFGTRLGDLDDFEDVGRTEAFVADGAHFGRLQGFSAL